MDSNSLLQPPPENPYSPAKEIAQYLQQFNQIPGSPYVHPRLISFPSGAQKANWVDHLGTDAPYCDTFSYFKVAPKSGKKVWIATFSSSTSTWVGDRKWSKRPLHVWGITLIKASSGQGRHLIIWDCDPRPPADVRLRDLLPAYQMDFVDYLRSWGMILSVWYNHDSAYSKQDKCLLFTMDWVKRMAEMGDIAFEGGSDPRVQQCYEFRRL